MLIFAVLAVSCLGCSDDVTGSRMSPPRGGARLSGNYVCSVDVVAQRTSCRREGSTGSARGPAMDILSTPVSVEALLSNERYDPADSTYRADVKIANRTERLLGSPDGGTVSGVKVFFEKEPVVTEYRAPGGSSPSGRETSNARGDTGVARVRNPDGRQTFTRVLQPYFFYPQVIQPDRYSASKEWQWTVPPNVSKFDFTVRVFAVTPGEVHVPVEIPRNWSVPFSRYYNPRNQGYCGFGGAGPCVYDVVSVLFHDNATQEEMQVAVNVVDGTVEGGLRSTGRYFIRLPTDTTFEVMRGALGKLRSLPQVRWAAPYDLSPVSVDHLRPVDGPGWQNWQLKDSLASKSRRTWGLEAISAPLAWGCETGTIGGKIGIVDTDFHEPTDLAGRLVDGGDKGVPIGGLNLPQDSVDHGTRVASIIAAAGNNSTEMTGVLWNAAVRTYDFAVWDSAQGAPYRYANGSVALDPQMAIDELVKAAIDGVSVINMSIGVDWNQQGVTFGYISAGQTYDPAKETNAARLARNDSFRIDRYEMFRKGMSDITSAGKNPLIVMSAGNNKTSTAWDGFKIAADSFPDNVIVVAGAEDAGSGRLRPMGSTVSGMTFGTNYGPQVQISAPGEDVWMLNRGGQVRRSGTSFAAPYVTGVAGLLLAFDPRLEQQGQLLKQLILEGARNSARAVVNGASSDSVPVLSAHGALKAAAQRPGAPLCGNRVWLEGNTARIRRVVNGSEQTETLFSVDDGADYLQVLHGGKRMYLSDGPYSNNQGYRFMRWVPGHAAWVDETIPPDSLDARLNEYGPVWNSLVSLSHDRDSVVQVRTSGGVAEVWVTDTLGMTRRQIGAVPLPGSESRGASVCVVSSRTVSESYRFGTYRDDTTCVDSIWPYAITSSRASPAAWVPGEHRVLLAVNEVYSENGVTGVPYECHTRTEQWRRLTDNMEADSGYLTVTYTCRDHAQSSSKSRSTIHSLPTTGGATSSSYAEPGVNLRNLSVSDGTREMVVQRETSGGTTTTRYKPGAGHYVKVQTSSGPGSTCVTQFRALAGYSAVYQRAGCAYSDFSFAPLQTTGDPRSISGRALTRPRPHARAKRRN